MNRVTRLHCSCNDCNEAEIGKELIKLLVLDSCCESTSQKSVSWFYGSNQWSKVFVSWFFDSNQSMKGVVSWFIGSNQLIKKLVWWLFRSNVIKLMFFYYFFKQKWEKSSGSKHLFITNLCDEADDTVVLSCKPFDSNITPKRTRRALCSEAPRECYIESGFLTNKILLPFLGYQNCQTCFEWKKLCHDVRFETRFEGSAYFETDDEDLVKMRADLSRNSVQKMLMNNFQNG